ncbi:dephospho-CoA kinase [Cognatiyoonia koreensis]|uniref:Dephospho-CoA kinase n=1 Tax=Cognatiyoonia koreensis TaxID=364200 RepID=A0A1I0RPP0_9RHOB|nr:dephospho-CoA kinase [Cognatiyoonia koreensis]SEW43208.1 dephospho-CoA kinase [Cognatiyoonia koreensis]
MTFALGLTGSIGMGKTTTARMFADEGIPVWDADETVHRLYAAGGAAVTPVAKLIPAAIQDGAVSRSKLKEAIASDPDILRKLEEIVHPLVKADREAFRAEQSGLILFDIPLLFETRADVWLDAVLVVTSPQDVQRQRVLDRPGMTEDQFELILSRQMPDSEKRVRADYIIETISLDQTRKEVQNVIADIRGKLPDA